MPGDIGSGAFVNCSGSGSVFSCSGNLNIGDNDTVVLTGGVTLSVAGELKIGKNVDISNSGFLLTFNVNGKAEIEDDSSVSANITSGDDFKIKKGVQFTGNINSATKVEIDDESVVVGDITAAVELKIDKKAIVFGTCSPTHPRCTGGGLGSMCTITEVGTGGEEFRGISGSSDSNVIAAGKDGSLYHFDGSDWNKHAFTSDKDLNDVEVVNANLAYAVGKDGKVIVYDGSNWTTLAIPTSEDLFGVWAASSTEVWVVGKNNSLYLWNGTSWSDMSGVGQANVDNGEDLTDIWGGTTYQYSLEKDGDLYRYARPSGPWSKITACSASFDVDKAEDIWGDNSGKIYLAAKDKDTDEASVFLFNEATNSCSKVFGTDTEKEVAGISGHGRAIYAVGKNGLVLDNSSGSWEESFKGIGDLLDVWVSPSGTPYYIGKNGYVTTCTSPNPPLDHFRIEPDSTNASTCLPNTITITAEDIDDIPIVDYFNTVDISVSTNHGNWSIKTANGSLSPNPDTDNNGAASYSFVAADASTIMLDLSNTHAETLDITVYDAIEGISSTLAGVSFSENVFIISEDPIQIAGRPQAMTIAMWTDDTANSIECGIDTSYNNGAQNLVADIDRPVGVLAGAADPTISGISIEEADESTAIVLDFATTPGIAIFDLDTSDVGQYILNILDISNVHSSTTIPGSTSLLTVRPFGLAVTNIVAGATANPGNNTAALPIFTSAGGAFSATVAGVLWDSNDDNNVTGGDGIVDGPGLYDDNTPAPSFAAVTNLTVAGSGFTPAAIEGGVAGTLANGAVTISTGSVTVNNLQYSEVGSFTLQSNTPAYLGGVDITGDDIVVGRFNPASFQVSVEPGMEGMLGNSCGVFTYIGQEFGYVIEPKFRVTAMNSMPTPGVTDNYLGAYAKLDKDSTIIDVATDSTTMGTDSTLLKVRYIRAAMPDPTINNNGTVDYEFGADTFAYGPDDTTQEYARDANSEVPPFTADIEPVLTQISDGEVTTNPSPSFIFDSITGNDLRFGRINMSNTHDSELVDLTMPVFTEYLQPGGVYTPNDDDNCTSLATADLGIVDNLSTPGSSSVSVDNTPTAIMGIIDVE